MEWVKSSYSASQDECVEVAILPNGGHAVRDSKDSDGPMLQFTAHEWRAFVARVKQA